MNTIPNLSKACDVLRILTERQEGISLLELSRELQIPRTTAFRILNTFCDQGLATKENGDYAPGPELAHIGLLALNRLEIRDLARPLLAGLSHRTGETAHLAMLSGNKSLILEVCDSPHPIRAASRAGTLADLHASSTGKVFLAFLDEESRRSLLVSMVLKARTKNTLTTVSKLLKECARIIRQGYAIDNEEYHVGMRCLAAPVRNECGKVIAAIGITGTADRFTSAQDGKVAHTVVSAAAQLSQSMGFYSKAA